jgi:hypothetical protein
VAVATSNWKEPAVMVVISGRRAGLALALVLAVAASASASDKAADELAAVKQATNLLEEIASDPNCGIPRANLWEAQGILIIPRVVEKQLGVGRKKGHGIFMPRNQDGTWGRPEPFEVSGLSVGAEAGREVEELVVIYRTREAARKYGDLSFAMSIGAEWTHALKKRQEFHSEGRRSRKDVIVFRRHHGLTVSVGVQTERRWGPSYVPPDPKLTDAATAKAQVGQAEGEGPAKAGAASDATVRRGKAVIAENTAEMNRLKAVLTAVSTRPAEGTRTAAARTKDSNVRPTGGATSPASTAGSQAR